MVDIPVSDNEAQARGSLQNSSGTLIIPSSPITNSIAIQSNSGWMTWNPLARAYDRPDNQAQITDLVGGLTHILEWPVTSQKFTKNYRSYQPSKPLTALLKWTEHRLCWNFTG